MGTKEAEGFEEDLDSTEYHDATEETARKEETDDPQLKLRFVTPPGPGNWLFLYVTQKTDFPGFFLGLFLGHPFTYSKKRSFCGTPPSGRKWFPQPLPQISKTVTFFVWELALFHSRGFPTNTPPLSVVPRLS